MSEKRRLFTAQIVESDSFISMSLAAQCLYLHYCINADDDGFIKNPRSILRMISTDESKQEELSGAFDELIKNSFVIEFNDGVIVIKHWHIHNMLRKDRYKETEYTEQRDKLYIKANGSYTLDSSQGQRYIEYLSDKGLSVGCQVVANGLPSGCQAVALSKDKLSKDNINNACARESKKDSVKKWGGVSREIDYDELKKQCFAN